MSVIRTLNIRCDVCGERAAGGDPRYGVRALRRGLRAEGWSTAQGAQGGPGRDVCPACLLAELRTAEAARLAKRAVGAIRRLEERTGA